MLTFVPQNETNATVWRLFLLTFSGNPVLHISSIRNALDSGNSHRVPKQKESLPHVTRSGVQPARESTEGLFLGGFACHRMFIFVYHLLSANAFTERRQMYVKSEDLKTDVAL
ncbi:hypothetical protein TNCV_2961491 [Trichonephila clavipes]|nr:hypothetical protein TNCV_2961491 [Trichonephila clavipes]